MPYLLYKIFADGQVIYLGRTKQPLARRLYGHFFGGALQKQLSIQEIQRIEYAIFQTEADLFLYEIYYINLLHPPLNRDDKAKDNLTVSLPEAAWTVFETQLLQKWEAVLQTRAEALAARKTARKLFFQEKRNQKKHLSPEEFQSWLKENAHRIED